MKTMKLLLLLPLLLLPLAAPAQWLYTTNTDGTLTITDYTNAATVVTVPGSINGRTVTAIGYLAFYDTGVTSVTIPDSVTRIGNDAFNDCLDLDNITIGRGVTNIGSLAFVYCYNLEAAYFRGNVPTNDASLFSGDENVTAYYFPGTTNWTNFALLTGVPVVLWNPQAQPGASFGVKSNQFGFNIIGTSNLVIVVQACTNLASPSWLSISTNTLTGGASYFSDPQWNAFSRRFYRFSSP